MKLYGGYLRWSRLHCYIGNVLQSFLFLNHQHIHIQSWTLVEEFEKSNQEPTLEAFNVLRIDFNYFFPALIEALKK